MLLPVPRRVGTRPDFAFYQGGGGDELAVLWQRPGAATKPPIPRGLLLRPARAMIPKGAPRLQGGCAEGGARAETVRPARLRFLPPRRQGGGRGDQGARR